MKWFKRKKHKVEANDIAIIGMACRFPGAETYQDYWENLANGLNSVREITPDRWDTNQYYSTNINIPNKSSSKWGGLLDDIAGFDAGFFNVSPREAQQMDPQQRLLLQETWHCLEDSGISIKILQQHRTSVYVGVMAVDYQQILAETSEVDSYACIGNYGGILANRISYYFGLTGESKTLDTACSSSLVALHDARRSLLNDECDYALAAGVNVICHPWKYISFSKSHMLSPDGQCKTFDKDANGYVPGEGIGIVLLTTFKRALKQGYRIHGILKGSSVNHTGKSLSITAPLVAAQRAVIIAAQQAAGIHPELITYVEAHGTGTSLGDPIEVESLTQAFQQTTKQNQYCALGSVKTNIGHLEAAAGIAGIIKVVLMMQHQKLVPTLHVKTINPLIDFTQTPFYLSRVTTDWLLPVGVAKRYAGVSSFGFGGVNSHVILEEYPTRVLTTPSLSSEINSYPFVLSAKSPASLQDLITEWQAYSQNPSFLQQRLSDISYTLLFGREMLTHRLGLWVSSCSDLAQQLQELKHSSLMVKERVVAALWISPSIKVTSQGFFILCQQHPKLKKHFDICCEILVQLKQRHLVRQWLKYKMPMAFPRLFEAITVYSFSSYLLELGFDPSMVGGIGVGQVIAAAVSGYLPLPQALQLLLMQEGALHQKQDFILSLQSPRLPFYDAYTQTIIYPFLINANTCQHLRQNLLVDNDLLYQLKEQAQLLRENQFTFKQYLESWNEVLQQEKNLTLDRLWTLSEGSQHLLQASDMLLLQVILLSCLKKLQYRWQLTEKTLNIEIKLAALVDLIAKDLLPYELVITWLYAGEESTCIQLAERLQNQQGSIKSQLEVLFPSPQSTIPLSSIMQAWLATDKGLGSTVSLPANFTDSMQLVLLGKNFHLQSNLMLEDINSFPLWILTLWAQNLLSEELREAYPFQGQFVSLPTYPFQKRKYWAKLHNKRSSLKEEMVSHNSLVGDLYDGFLLESQQAEDSLENNKNNETLLTFGPFNEVVPSFSWSRAFQSGEHETLMVRAQQEMRDILFRRVNFSDSKKVLDFGCGYGNDLISLWR